MKAAFDRAMVWMVDHRRFTFGMIMLTTVLSIIGHVRPHWVRGLFVSTEETAAAKSNEKSEPERKAPNVGGVFQIAGESIIVAESKQFFTPRTAAALLPPSISAECC